MTLPMQRFFFRINGVSAWELPYQSTVQQEGHVTKTVYRFARGLTVTNITKAYPTFGAWEWVNYFENTGEIETDLLSDIWDCDCAFPMEYEAPYVHTSYFPDPARATKLYAPNGSTCSAYDFFSDADRFSEGERVFHLYPGAEKTYTASGGRSSEQQAPFFRVHQKDRGYFFAVGWTGQWKCSISRDENHLFFRSKVEDTQFKILPGERFRTSSVVVMPYAGSGADAHNQWRRLLRRHFSICGTTGRTQYAPFSACIWGGMASHSVLARIRTIQENALPFEYVWLDAGWYGNTQPTPDEFEGDWGEHTGDWRISRATHPNGLQDVAAAVHKAGMKFLLWIEPERVTRLAPIVGTHPDFFLDAGEKEGFHFLLNLGNPEAWQYCYNTLSNLIQTLQIDCYRQDFNLSPLPYWREHDNADRTGMTEILHINGLYRLWDALLSAFPHLCIDNCASGGRRIDIETLRRSVPLWRSDFQCSANYDVEASQCHSLTYGAWMPYSGTGTGRGYDVYRVRSAYAPGLAMQHAFSEREPFCDTPEAISFLKQYGQEYLKVRPFLTEDIYPLTECSDRTDIWCAVQYDRPQTGEGVIQIFRREHAPYETACFFLGGIQKEKQYHFWDADGGEFTACGSVLAQEGLRFTILTRRTAKLYFYKTF